MKKIDNIKSNNPYISYGELEDSDYGEYKNLVKAAKEGVPMDQKIAGDKVKLIDRKSFYLGIIPGSQDSFIKSILGHDCVCMDDESTHTYYVIDGFGDFEIDGKKYGVGPGSIVTIPPTKEFTYYGNMTMILNMNPPFNEKTNHSVKTIEYDGNVPTKK